MYRAKGQPSLKRIIRKLFFFAMMCTFLPLSNVWAQGYWTPMNHAATDIGIGGDHAWILVPTQYSYQFIYQGEASDHPSWTKLDYTGTGIAGKSNGGMCQGF